MLLAVAGLTPSEIETRSQAITSGQWEEFTPAEQLAFTFARKLTVTPGRVDQADLESMSATFGPSRAVDIVWYVAWCNYMTRVADAFQLPLEQDNVFQKREE